MTMCNGNRASHHTGRPWLQPLARSETSLDHGQGRRAGVGADLTATESMFVGTGRPLYRRGPQGNGRLRPRARRRLSHPARASSTVRGSGGHRAMGAGRPSTTLDIPCAIGEC